ncbi:MAG TPA: hypothetical protein VNW25_00035 [Candidatus Sulfotelmatobacter sp.]|nr:hypothetical protein [Candidatus Sulfotelmatobacter sp.]
MGISWPPPPLITAVSGPGVACRAGDQVRIDAVGSSAFNVVGIVNVLETATGRTNSYETGISASSSDRSFPAVVPAALTNPLVDGFITSIFVSTPGAAANTPLQPGILWCALDLLRGGRQIATLGAGWCWSGGNLSLGKIVWNADRSNPGRIYNIRTASTALLAAGVSFGPPSKAIWRIKGFSIKLVTSGTAGSRLILVYMTDGTTAPVSGTEGQNVLVEWVNSGTFGTGRTVITGTTERYSVGAYQTVDASSTINKIMQADLVIPSTFKLFIQDTAAIDAAADLVTIDVTVEEWFSG